MKLIAIMFMVTGIAYVTPSHTALAKLLRSECTIQYKSGHLSDGWPYECWYVAADGEQISACLFHEADAYKELRKARKERICR